MKAARLRPFLWPAILLTLGGAMVLGADALAATPMGFRLYDVIQTTGKLTLLFGVGALALAVVQAIRR